MSHGLRAYSRATAFIAFLLLLAGGLVTSTGSSLSVPDWPLSFGTLFPPMLGGVLFEHGHRLLAGTVSLMTFCLTVWCYRSESRAWVRRVATFAAGAIVAQALLGGLTVLLRLPPIVSISHACLAQAVFCSLLVVAQAETAWFQTQARPVPGMSWLPGALAVAAVYGQLIFGAVIRHTGQHVPYHLIGAAIASLALLNLMRRGLGASALTGPSALLAFLLPCQLGLGVLSYRAKFSPDFLFALDRTALLTTAHLGVGAMILGACVIWTLRAWRQTPA